MNNLIYQKQKRELDFKEIAWNILSQWKAVLLLSLVLMLIICGSQYRKDMEQYKSDVAAKEEAAKMNVLSQEERIEAVMDALPEEERAAAYFIISERDWAKKQKEYLRESILMQTDPANQRVLKIVFDIDCENNDDVPVLVHSYMTYLYSNEVIEAIKPSIKANTENKYIEELFYNDGIKETDTDISGNSGTIEVSIVLPEDADAEAVASAISSAFSDYNKEKAKNRPHSIEMAEFDVVHTYNSNNVNKRMSAFNNVNNIENTLRTAETALSASQRAAVEAVMKIKGEANNDSGSDIAENTLSKPTISKKHILLSLILGICFYIVAYIAFLIFRGCINSAADAAHHTQSRTLGEIYYAGDNKGLRKLFHSNIISKVRYKNKRDAEGQINKLVNSLKAVCEHAGISSFSIINITGKDDTNSFTVNEILDKMADSAKSIYPDASLINITDSFEESDMLSLDDALLIVSNNTKVSELEDMMSLCCDYGKKILGNVYVSER